MSDEPISSAKTKEKYLGTKIKNDTGKKSVNSYVSLK